MNHCIRYLCIIFSLYSLNVVALSSFSSEESDVVSIAQHTLKNAMGFALGDVIARTVAPPITHIFKVIIDGMYSLGTIGAHGYNALCNRPNPLTLQDLQAWESIVESMSLTLCEQPASGAIMLRNIRVQEQERMAGSPPKNWQFYVTCVREIFSHIICQLDAALPYYQHNSNQRTLLVRCARALTPRNYHSIAFFTKTIMINLSHIIDVCEQAGTADDLDTEHIKKVARNTLLLFKKLSIMIQGTAKNELSDTAVSGMASQAHAFNY